MMRGIRRVLYKAFQLIMKPFIGTGIGRFRPVLSVYGYLARMLIPAEQRRLIYVNDCKIFLHTKEYEGIDAVALQLLLQGTYEQYTTDLFKKLVGEGMTVIDIGANIGYYTLLAAKLVGEKGRVFAFEPEPRNYALLTTNIEANALKNIIALQNAVSSEAGHIKLYLDKFESGSHSLFKSKRSMTEAITVDSVSLDDFFENKDSYHIDIVKIDVEGAEIAVLQGMIKILDKNPTLKMFIEFSPANLKKAGFSAQQFWDKLIECDFKFIYPINKELKEKLEIGDFPSAAKCYKDTEVGKFGYINLLCTKILLR